MDEGSAPPADGQGLRQELARAIERAERAERALAQAEAQMQAALGRAVLLAQDTADRTVAAAQQQARAILAEAAATANAELTIGERPLGVVKSRFLASLDQVERRIRDRLDSALEAVDTGGPATPDPECDEFRATLLSAWHHSSNGHAPGTGSVVRLRAGDVSLDPSARVAKVGSRQVALDDGEARVLELFLENSGRVLHRQTLTQRLGGREIGQQKVDSVVRRLRTKLGEDRDGRGRITTVRGEGYRFRTR